MQESRIKFLFVIKLYNSKYKIPTNVQKSTLSSFGVHCKMKNVFLRMTKKRQSNKKEQRACKSC